MTFPAISLFLGSEIGEKKDAITTQQRALEKKMGQIDRHTFYPFENSMHEIVSVLANASLFSAARFVIVKNAELIKKKEDIQILAGWLDTATRLGNQNDSFLILTSDENSIDKKIEKLVPKQHKKIFWEMFENRKEQWLVAWFKKNKLLIEPEAVEAILEMVENNTESLRNECSRFTLCFAAGHTINIDDVENVLAHNREETAFSLFNALSDNSKVPVDRLSSSLSILQKLNQTKSSNSIQLIAGLSYCFRKLRIWHTLHASGRPSDFDLKINGFSSKKAQKRYAHASNIWNLRSTIALLALMSSTDMQIRSGGATHEKNILQVMIYCIVIKNGIALED